MTPAPQLSLGLLLTGAAGMIDVIGFIELGGFYTSFMSGNTTQLGAGLAHMVPHLVLPASLVIMFVVGSFLGSLIAFRADSTAPMGVLALVLVSLAASLLLSAIGFSSAQAMVVLAIGAGAQNAVLPQRGAARLGATFVTGTLFGAGQDLARAVRGEAHVLRWLQHMAVWVALMLGAFIGAVFYGLLHIWALVLPGVIYVSFFIGFAVYSRRAWTAR